MSIIKTSIKQPVLVNLLFALVLIAGVIYGSAITKELFPEVNPPGVMVTAAYPGVSAEEMEKLVTRPLEDAVADADHLEDIISTTSEGLSVIWVEFSPDADVDKAVVDVQTRVNEAQSTLPPDALTPRVRSGGRQMPVIQVALMGRRGGDPHQLRRSAELLAERLEAIPDVHTVNRSGIRQREIRVVAKPAKLEAYDVSLTAMASTLSARNRNLPGGTVVSGTRELTVRAMSEYTSLDDLRDVVIKRSPDGKHVRVRDVATVLDTFADRSTGAWVDGEQGVLLSVVKRDAADAHDVVRTVKAELETSGKALPAGFQVKTFGDTTRQVDHTMGVLYQNGVMGVALVLALLWLFLGFRNALFAALGIPFALAGGVVVMYMLGVTINQLSLFALILCIGIIVDDAVVVVENCYRHLERGASPRVAALLGAKEVMWPVVATVLTTIAAFLPMLLMEGVFGQFLSVIPKVVVAALAASLIEALIVLPSHVADFPSRVRKGKGDSLMRWLAARVYRPSFRRVLRWRYLVVPAALTVAAALIAALMLGGEVNLFSGNDGEQFDVRVQMPRGTSLVETERVLRQVEGVTRSLPDTELHAVLTQSGWSRTSLFPRTGKHLGMVTVILKPAKERVRNTAEVMAALRPRLERIAGPVRPVELVEGGFKPPTGDPVAVRLQGDDLGRLLELAQQVEGTLGQLPGVKDVGRDYHLGSPEYRLRVDESRAAQHGMGTADVSRALNIAYMGYRATKYRQGDEEIDVVLRYPEATRRDARKLSTLALPLRATAAAANRLTPPQAGGSAVQRLSVGDVASIERAPGASSISRRSRRRTVTVTASLDPGHTSHGVNRDAGERLGALMAANPDVTFSFGGEFERVNESLDSLWRAFAVALLLIYLILAAQFRSFAQPLVVLLAVPLSAVGAAVGFLVSGQAIDFVALLGLVGLAGIVVNDSLILVEFINQRRRQGMDRDEAIARAGQLRVRPILLTSITTVAGLLPMSLGWFGDAGGLAPMATAMAWGLSFATVLTLYVVPAAYGIVDDMVSLAYRMLRRERAEPEQGDDELDAADRLPVASI